MSNTHHASTVLPRDLHEAAKQAAASRGISLSAWIQAIISEEIERLRKVTK
jgi:predicted HicB family RNase H-like nuclease